MMYGTTAENVVSLRVVTAEVRTDHAQFDLSAPLVVKCVYITVKYITVKCAGSLL